MSAAPPPDLPQAVRALLDALEVPPSPEMVGTPDRVARLWREQLLSGYGQDPAEILSRAVIAQHEGVIAVSDIPFHCVCPHHLTPAFGRVHLAYAPQGRVVGFGALEALVTALSRRLILQEQLTAELADALMLHLDARGAACAIEATHFCMILRGREAHAARARTVVERGCLKGQPHRWWDQGSASGQVKR
ncbi:GTP cyclohydrolase I [Myxococcota bacterium]|nr:GTP cyclohydrolase I [Myxococcota bacterium]MBU1428979.1 GTP cyclohydrolase I [Myxococcota bacterium]MBU1897645.1 GTP cyclohydrolase I [Myxococcota bacterium]